jgi:dual specificity tyrosine-phosphorylation-regulated kinase 2/3/4
VVRVLDHKKKVECAVKIILNKKKFEKQALVELKILTFIKEKDEENLTNIVKISDYIIFRNHVVSLYRINKSASSSRFFQ